MADLDHAPAPGDAGDAPAQRPFSPACERNREPILAVLRVEFADRARVLEVGSGTGQHAVHFAAAMPWLTWQCADRREYLPGISQWLQAADLPNTPPPLVLDVADWAAHGAIGQVDVHARADAPDAAGRGGQPRYDALFSANTLHIMSWQEVRWFFAGLPQVLAAEATVVVYGPFNDDGRYSSDSNRAFDASLKARDPRMGIRDASAVDALAAAVGLRRTADIAMPANNRCLVWRRG